MRSERVAGIMIISRRVICPRDCFLERKAELLMGTEGAQRMGAASGCPTQDSGAQLSGSGSASGCLLPGSAPSPRKKLPESPTIRFGQPPVIPSAARAAGWMPALVSPASRRARSCSRAGAARVQASLRSSSVAVIPLTRRHSC